MSRLSLNQATIKHADLAAALRVTREAGIASIGLWREPVAAVGLATAVALQRRGHDVTVLEGRSDATTGAGISIWPNALAALDHIGLGDAVREAGGRVTAGAIRWRDGKWLRRPSRERS